MKRLLMLALTGAALAACAEGADEADETAADTTAVVEEAPALTQADLAGTWNMTSVPATGPDTTATVYTTDVTADSWTMNLPDRDPIVAVTSVSGDSIVVDAGPYESVRRDGQMVTTRAVLRLDGDRLVGQTVATYDTGGDDSVLILNTEGTRAP